MSGPATVLDADPTVADASHPSSPCVAVPVTHVKMRA
jgi:hypothetical protein